MVGESCDVFAIRVLFAQTFAVSCVKNHALTLTHLFVKVHTYLDRRQRKNLFGPRVNLPLVTAF